MDADLQRLQPARVKLGDFPQQRLEIGVPVATEPLWEASHNGSYGQPMILGSRVVRGGGNRLPCKRFSEPVP
jgi:hypothetical protein